MSGAPAATQSPDWPAATEALNEQGTSPIVLVCEHASNYIPPEYHGLGVGPSELRRHIAWDIGAAHLTRELASRLDASAFLGTYSRLLIDLNRPVGVAASICTKSEATEVPGNQALSPQERTRRIDRIFTPFQSALGAHVRERIENRRATVLICIHSFTPVYLGVQRALHIGVLFDRGIALAGSILAELGQDPDLSVAANAPYGVSRSDDFALLVHGDDLDIPAALIEVRHDLIADCAQGSLWANRLAVVLRLQPQQLLMPSAEGFKGQRIVSAQNTC